MKVLVLAPSMARAGGIQRYTTTLVTALKELLGGENVHCMAAPELPHAGGGHGGFSFGLKLHLGSLLLGEAARWRPDLVICTHLALGPVGWLLARLGRQPYWVVAHGIEAWARLPIWKRAALRRANRVVVTSAFSQEQVVKRHNIDGKRISRLPCALDETLLNVEPAKSVSYRHISDGQRVVLMVARMEASERYKGHDVVLRALPSVLAKIPNVTYLVVGDGDDRPRLERLAKQSGLIEHVVFTGEVSESELAAFYQRSEIFILPARTVLDEWKPKGEGFGIVFLEAMAFGKPVVGPNYGAPLELIRHGENGLLVDPEDATSVSEALIRLLTSPEKAREMGQAGRGWVRKAYSYGSFHEKLRQMVAQSVYDTQRLPRFGSADEAISTSHHLSKRSPRAFRSAGVQTIWESLFLLWVIIVNMLYYAQFRSLLGLRVGRFLDRWR
jgi:glycosyltransferase involved in cell wall biosynthesis